MMFLQRSTRFVPDSICSFAISHGKVKLYYTRSEEMWLKHTRTFLDISLMLSDCYFCCGILGKNVCKGKKEKNDHYKEICYSIKINDDSYIFACCYLDVLFCKYFISYLLHYYIGQPRHLLFICCQYNAILMVMVLCSLLVKVFCMNKCHCWLDPRNKLEWKMHFKLSSLRCNLFWPSLN